MHGGVPVLVVLGTCGGVWHTADAQYERRADNDHQDLARCRALSELLVDTHRQPLEIWARVGQQELEPLARAQWCLSALDRAAAVSVRLMHANLEGKALGLGDTAHIYAMPWSYLKPYSSSTVPGVYM